MGYVSALRWTAAIAIAAISGFCTINLLLVGLFADLLGSPLPPAAWFAAIPLTIAIATGMWALLLPHRRWWGIGAVLLAQVMWFAVSGGLGLI